MQMTGGKIVSVGAVVVLSFLGAIALREVAAQQTASGPTSCDVSDDCSASQYCAGGNPDTSAKEGRCNVPPPIWNVNALSNPAGFHQDASINLAGKAAFGGFNLDPTILVTTPSLFAAKAQIGYGSTIPDDNGLSVKGNLNVGGCFGPVFKGTTPPVGYDGGRGGYRNVHGYCNALFSGSHVCSTAEILNSVACQRDMPADNSFAWINNGAPALPVQTNDCIGWTTAAIGNSGVAWQFTSAGGIGWAKNCANTYAFACCR